MLFVYVIRLNIFKIFKLGGNDKIKSNLSSDFCTPSSNSCSDMITIETYKDVINFQNGLPFYFVYGESVFSIINQIGRCCTGF